ncbi:MAG: hypothetical protein K6G00_00420 [Treponema sp.]|nr:hypothetical protein [Treponema sp.]
MVSKKKLHDNKMSGKTLFIRSLIPLLAITFMAGLILAIISEWLIKRYVQAETTVTIEKLNSEISDFISPAVINVENFSNFAKVTNERESLQILCETFAKSLPYALSFYYASSDFHTGKNLGLYVDSDNWVPPDDWIPKERDWFINAISKDGEIAFADAYIDAMSNELCFSISKTVKDSNGKLRGVVANDLKLSNLAEMVKDVSVSPNSHIYLLNAEGKYMTNEDDSKILNINYFDDSKIPYAKNEYLDGTQKANIDGKYFYAIKKIDKTPWFIAVEGPVKDFTGKSKRMAFMLELLLAAFSLIFSYINIRFIMKMRASEKKLGEQIITETQGLAAAAKENAATSQDQNAAVKEIVATMEDNNELSGNISKKIKDVVSVAGETNKDVSLGVESIEQNVLQLKDIAEANKNTINDIKNLSEKIENIWEIVTLINSVADQAKIIAFNAELEASSAGEAGKNFHIVATEIRRLADGIIDGTKEIKEKIGEIQKSSDCLILASESGTEKINSGVEKANNLRENFESIKSASEITASSAKEITAIIQQQAAASEQILITLRQIAAGAESFNAATENISSASQKLRNIAEDLNK